MIYLATPYSHPDPEVQEIRFKKAMHIVYWHLRQGIYLYSPILAHHPIQKEYNLPGGYAFWEQSDTAFISSSSAVWFADMPGWLTSKGMEEEYKVAKELSKDIYQVFSVGAGYAHYKSLGNLYA